MHHGLRPYVAAIAVLLALIPVGTALGSFETLLEIVQPMMTTEGIRTATVTYSEYLTETPLGYCVTFLGRESRIMDQQGHAVNRNVANLTGIRAWAEPRLLGDTLRVFLDLRKFVLDRATIADVESNVIDATRKCLLLNAYNSRDTYDSSLERRVAARYIDVRVLGDKRFAYLAGVVACTDIAKSGTVPYLPPKPPSVRD